MATPSQIQAVLRAALMVAAAAPVRQNRYSYRASVPWYIIAELRHDLEALGLDWRPAARIYHEELRRRDDAPSADASPEAPSRP